MRFARAPHLLQLLCRCAGHRDDTLHSAAALRQDGVNRKGGQAAAVGADDQQGGASTEGRQDVKGLV